MIKNLYILIKKITYEKLYLDIYFFNKKCIQ